MIIEKKHPMPTLDPKLRSHCFDEVTLGYDEKTAINEANRCLNCKNMPCVNGCPVKIHIPEFIQKIKEGKFEDAYKIINKSSSLPAICGRVCPQESQCEKHCTLGIKFEPVAIGYLERFVADWHNTFYKDKTKKIKSNGKKIAIVGSGPSGLACAGDLAKLGYSVTIFESLHEVGGGLTYGIPEFRLPKSIVNQEVKNLKSLGVKFNTNVVIGKTIVIDELFKMGFKAIFISSGAGLPKFMNIPGENLKGVYSANEFLSRVNLMKAYKKNSSTPLICQGKIAVIGGGNVAMDAARTALRLGAKSVDIIYRRSEDEMPARKEERIHAKEEGIRFNILTNPVEIIGNNDGFVSKIKCIKMKLDEPDSSGRRKPVEILNSEFLVDADIVIMAIGSSPNPLIKNTTHGLNINSHGCIIVNECGLSSKPNVYAGGDIVTGAATVISAMSAGKLAAKSIHEKLK